MPAPTRSATSRIPTTGLEAKFSLRQTVAMALTGVDTAELDSYNDAVTQEPRIKALRDKMSIEFKPNWEHSLAEMAIQLDDGTTLEATHDSGIPWADVARQRRALETKFESLVTPRPGRRRHQAPARRHRAHRQPGRCGRTRARLGEGLDVGRAIKTSS